MGRHALTGKFAHRRFDVSTLPNLSQVARGVRPLFILIQYLEANNKVVGRWGCAF